MKADSLMETADECSHDLAHLLSLPLETKSPSDFALIDGVRIGKLVGFADAGVTPLVTYPGQPTSAALPARAMLDIHAAHFGRDLVLMFESSDPRRPIVMGCLHDSGAHDRSALGEQVAVDADGQRLVVTARDQLVLRCGKASITLTKEGKVILQGAYVSSQSSGVMRIKGGSVQIN